MTIGTIFEKVRLAFFFSFFTTLRVGVCMFAQKINGSRISFQKRLQRGSAETEFYEISRYVVPEEDFERVRRGGEPA